MGLLLTFMFLWNMVGAIVMIPALAAVLGIGGSSAATAGFDQPASAPARAD
jgi:hypothetical protein